MVGLDFEGPIPLFVARRWERGERTLAVHRSYDRSAYASIWYASAEQVERAVATARAVREEAATKESGVGRERVRYAMTDLTYERVMVLAGPPL